jgi:hypothetical protein
VEAQKVIDSYRTPEMLDLSAQATTFGSRELARAFEEAVVSNVRVWGAFLLAIGSVRLGSGSVLMTEEVTRGMAAATESDRRVFALIREDLTWTDGARPMGRIKWKLRDRELRDTRQP